MAIKVKEMLTTKNEEFNLVNFDKVKEELDLSITPDDEVFTDKEFDSILEEFSTNDLSDVRRIILIQQMRDNKRIWDDIHAFKEYENEKMQKAVDELMETHNMLVNAVRNNKPFIAKNGKNTIGKSKEDEFSSSISLESIEKGLK